jgi:hypothetical protein
MFTDYFFKTGIAGEIFIEYFIPETVEQTLQV